jgi:hypothetical protein
VSEHAANMQRRERHTYLAGKPKEKRFLGKTYRAVLSVTALNQNQILFC